MTKEELQALRETVESLPEMEWRGCRDDPCWGEKLALVEERLVALREAISKLLTALEAERLWHPLWDDDGFILCEEAGRYLFAIDVCTNGDGCHWEYFSDSVIWDSEMPPQWYDGAHGWELSDVHWYATIDPPYHSNTKQVK